MRQLAPNFHYRQSWFSAWVLIDRGSGASDAVAVARRDYVDMALRARNHVGCNGVSCFCVVVSFVRLPHFACALHWASGMNAIHRFACDTKWDTNNARATCQDVYDKKKTLQVTPVECMQTIVANVCVPPLLNERDQCLYYNTVCWLCCDVAMRGPDCRFGPVSVRRHRNCGWERYTVRGFSQPLYKVLEMLFRSVAVGHSRNKGVFAVDDSLPRQDEQTVPNRQVCKLHFQRHREWGESVDWIVANLRRDRFNNHVVPCDDEWLHLVCGRDHFPANRDNRFVSAICPA